MSSSNTIQHCQNIISRSGGHSDIAWDLIKTPQATNLLFLTLTYHSGVPSDGKERRKNRTNALLHTFKQHFQASYRTIITKNLKRNGRTGERASIIPLCSTSASIVLTLRNHSKRCPKHISCQTKD